MAFNVPAVVRAIKAKNPVTNITDGAVRTYIVEQRIGCVGKSTKFLKHAHSISSAHISRAFITHEVLQGLDRGTVFVTITFNYNSYYKTQTAGYRLMCCGLQTTD